MTEPTEAEPTPWAERVAERVVRICQTSGDVGSLAVALVFTGGAHQLYTEASWLFGTFCVVVGLACVLLFLWAPWYAPGYGRPKLRRDRP